MTVDLYWPSYVVGSVFALLSTKSYQVADPVSVPSGSAGVWSPNAVTVPLETLNTLSGTSNLPWPAPMPAPYAPP